MSLLLIVPPWINKFYILDLSPDKSFIKWCVDQGGDGLLHLLGQSRCAAPRNVALPIICAKAPSQAFDVVEQIPARPSVHTIGYCVGGTLLAITLAYLAAQRSAGPR